MAEALNRSMAGKCREYPGRVSGMATVFPGEDGGGRIRQEALDSGLSGLKLHAHVQCCDMNAAGMEPLDSCCQAKYSLCMGPRAQMAGPIRSFRRSARMGHEQKRLRFLQFGYLVPTELFQGAMDPGVRRGDLDRGILATQS